MVSFRLTQQVACLTPGGFFGLCVASLQKPPQTVPHPEKEKKPAIGHTPCDPKTLCVVCDPQNDKPRGGRCRFKGQRREKLGFRAHITRCVVCTMGSSRYSLGGKRNHHLGVPFLRDANCGVPLSFPFKPTHKKSVPSPGIPVAGGEAGHQAILPALSDPQHRRCAVSREKVDGWPRAKGFLASGPRKGCGLPLGFPLQTTNTGVITPEKARCPLRG